MNKKLHHPKIEAEFKPANLNPTRGPAKAKLKHSEEKYKNLFENSLVGIFRTTLVDGLILEANSTLNAMLGFETLVGLKAVDLYLDPAHRELLKSRLQQEGLVENFETQLKRKDGTIIWVSFSARLYPQEGYLEGVMIDITQRKQTRIERERLLAAEREQRLLAETLTDITLALTAQTSPTAVLEEILRQVQRIVPCQKVSISLLTGDILRMAHKQGELAFERKFASGLEQPLADFPLDAEVVQTRKTLIIPDTQQEPRWVFLPNISWIRSHISAPICLGDQVLGLLRLDADTPGKFSTRDAERLKPLVNAAAIALENARLHEQARQEIAERKRAEQALTESQTRLKLLNSISTQITSGLSLQQVIEHTLNQIADYFPTFRVAYSTLDNQGHSVMLHSVEPPGMPHLIGLTANLSTAPKYLSGLRQHKAIIVADVNSDIQEPALVGLIAAGGTRAFLDMPLYHSDNLVGVLCLDAPEPHQWSEHEITTLTEVAEYLSIALQNVHQQQEREHTEAELRASEERFRLVINSISDHIYVTKVTDKGEHINLYISPHAEAMTGYPMENFMTDWRFWPSTVIHPDDRAAAAGQAAQLALGQHSEVEYRLVRADGQVIWVRDSARVQPEGPSARIVYGLVSDITERKQAELEREWLTNELRNLNQTLDERVRARTAELQAIFDAVGEGILVTKLNGVIEYINPALEKLTGFSAAEAIGKTPSIWRSERQNFAFYTQMWQTILAGQTWRGELVNKRKDGSLYDVLLAITPIPGPKGEPIGFVGVQSDITPFKEMDRLKSEFISMAAHELRTPLTSILGFSEILMTRQLSEERKIRYLTFINQQADALRAILDDLLDLSRMEAGEGFEITEDLVDLRKIAEEVVFGFQENQPTHHYQIVGYDSWPQIKGDPVKLAQLFKNLFSNATKYSPDGGEIVLKGELKETYNLFHFTLTDHGIGMTREQLDQVFERFYRADASNTAIGGTGLGMTISRLIVERHGGKIWVESQYGVGTTVHILLPLLNRPTYILIIEDDHNLRELQQRVLRAEGFVVLGVDEGGAGLKLASTCLPNLILLDLALPGMTGFDVLEQLRTNYLTRDIPVIITSAIDTATEIEKAIQKGAIDYLVKPYGMGDLTVRVNRVLAKPAMHFQANVQGRNKSNKI